MKKSLITIAFAVASMPMFAQTPATPPPAAGTTATTDAKPVKAKKHTKKVSKKHSKKAATSVAK